MKKILMILTAGCFIFVVACGPSAEEQAAEQKRIADSTAAAQKVIDDSIATAQQALIEQMRADSIAAAEAAKAVQDSIDAAKKKSTSKPKKTAPEKVQPGQGRGK
jgi:hypothetical protein